MYSTTGKALCVTALGFFFFGCAAISARMDQAAQSPPAQGQSSESYYFYATAQLEKKKGGLDRAIVQMRKAIDADPGSIFLRYELAMLHLLQRDQESALRVLEGILEKDADHVESLMMVGRINQSLDRMAAAQQAYERVVTVDPDREDVYVLLGKLYTDEDQSDKALKTYQRMVERFPGAYLGYFFTGRIYMEKGDLAAAEEKFLHTIELAPELEEPHYELLKIYDKQNLPAKKLAVYEDMLKKNPDNTEILMDLALFHQKSGNPDKADAIFQDLGRRSQTDRTLIPQIARKFLEQEAYDDAMILLDGMLRGAPENPDLNYLSGIAADGKGEKELAVAHMRKIGPDSRFYQNAVVHIAFIFQEAGKIPDAIALLKEAISNVSPDAELLLYLGSFYEETENYAEAEAAFLQGLAVDANNIKIRFRLGVLYDKQGNRESCIAEMKKVVAVDPKHANALNYLGYTYAEMGIELDQAEAFILRALEIQPDDGYITDSLGWVYYKKGLYEQAVTVLEKAASLVPDDPTILEHLGDAYLKMNNKIKAMELYKRSLMKNDKVNNGIEEKIRMLKEAEN